MDAGRLVRYGPAEASSSGAYLSQASAPFSAWRGSAVRRPAIRIALSCMIRVPLLVGQTIVFRGLSCVGKSEPDDRRQKAIVCPTCTRRSLMPKEWNAADISRGWKPGGRLWD